MENTLDQRTNTSGLLDSINWQYILRNGIIAGILLLYVGVIGMIEAFSEREIIRDTITLGQVLIFAPAVIMGFLTASRVRDESDNMAFAFGAGVFVGIMASLPSLLLLGINNVIEVRDMFVNVNRDWIEAITFDNRDAQLRGGLILFFALTAAGTIGGIVSLIPEKFRRALIWGTATTLLVAALADTISQILEEIAGDDVVDVIFRRDSMKRNPAIALFFLSTGATLIWGFFGQQVQTGFTELPDRQRTLSRNITYGLLFLFLLILPFLVGRALADVLVTVGLFVLMGFGLNIAIGFAGLLDLGYVTNYAVGAYVTAVLLSTGPLGIGPDWMTFWLVMPIALLAAMFAGFVFAVPVLKMRGDYLAIATLGFGEIIGKLAVSDALSPIIGGAQGVLFIPKPNVIMPQFVEGFGSTFSIIGLIVLLIGIEAIALILLRFGNLTNVARAIVMGFCGLVAVPIIFLVMTRFTGLEFGITGFGAVELTNPEQLYYIVFGACLLTLYVSIRLNNSRTGRQWMAIREDEDVAAAMGINTARAKLLAFTLSAATGGLAGAIFAVKVGTVFPNSFLVFVSINVLSLIIVGGMGSNPGIIVGALVLVGMPELLREFSEYRWLLYGALLIFMMVNRPEGLIPSQVTRREMGDSDDPEITAGDVDMPKNVNPAT